MSKRTNRFQMERLEDRRLMAGDVDVLISGVPGTMIIKAANPAAGAAEAVQVSKSPTGGVRITGLPSADGGVTKVNGKSFVDMPFTQNIDFRLGQGSDEVRIKNLSISGNINLGVGGSAGSAADNDRVIIDNLRIGGALKVTTARGQDFVSVRNSKIGDGVETFSNDDFIVQTGVDAAVGDADRDTVFIENVEVLGHTHLFTGASNDSLTLRDAELGHGTHHFHTALISTGAGADTVTLGPGPAAVGAVAVTGNLHIGTGLDSENDADVVSMQDVFTTNSLTMFLGGGGDVLDIVNQQARRDVAIITGSGDDTARFTQVEAFEGFFTSMGEGSDTLDITFVKARTVNLDGGDGAGFDRLFLSQSPNIPTLIRKGFEEINGQRLLKKAVVGPALTLRTA